jgi:transposase
MAIADRNGLPIAISVGSASPHEVTLVEETVAEHVTLCLPDKLIGDKAYDSDRLDERLATEWGIELIAPHRSNRTRTRTQDGRKLRRYKRRWKIERLFAWLQQFRRVVVRYENKLQNFLGFVKLAAIKILLRQF